MRARCSVLFVLLPTLLCVVAAGARAGIVTGTIQVDGGGTFLPLAVGTPAFGPTDRYVWSTIPDLLSSNGFSFWQTNPGPGWPSVPYGKITFNVTQSGPVYMAVTTRFGGGGNSSGGWIPELTSEAQLIAQGWHQVATGLSDVDSLSGNTDVDFLIFERDSVAGESFTYRTEKYIPPIPLTTQAIPPPPQPTKFVIDPAQSTVTLSVTAGTLAATEQLPGSLTTALQGSMMVDLNTPGAITFPGGGSASLVGQLGPFLPGNGPAELAGQIYVGTDLLIAGVLRGMQLDFFGAARPLDAQGHFDPSLSALVKAGALDYESDVLGSGTSPLTGTYANHQTATPGTFTDTNGQKKLVIPFDYESLGQQGGQIFNIALHGQIVAIAEVPEPATLTLAAMVGIVLAQRIRRCESRRRRQTKRSRSLLTS